MKPYSALIIVGFLLLASLVSAQEHVHIIHQIIEEMVMETEDEYLAEEYTEQLFYLYENPIDVNQATPEQWKEFFFLSQPQIQEIIEFVASRPLLTLYELQLIPGLDKRTAYFLSPFITVTELQEKSQFKPRLRNSLLMRIDGTFETKKGYMPDSTSDRYLGLPHRHLVKFRSVQKARFSTGFVIENDAGEKYQWKPEELRYGADFISAHVALENRGLFNMLLLGDYQLNVGQGLTLTHGFSMGKSADAVNIRKVHRGLKPYTGSHEYNYFRGFAASISWNNFTILPFFSWKFLDGRINTGPDNRKYISSIIQSGMHRTPKESVDRLNMAETIAGTDMLFQSNDKRLEAGFTIMKTRYQYPYQPNPNIYNQFTFFGQELLNSGLRLNYTFKNIYLFSELSSSDFSGYAGLAGFQMSVAPETNMAFVYRNYGKSYYANYSQPFSESSNQNEEGFYWGINMNLSKKWKLNLYYDLFRYPWLRYQLYTSASPGNEWMSKIFFTPNKSSQFYLQYKIETKEKNAESSGHTYQTARFSRHQYVFNIDINPAQFLNMKFRVQGAAYQQDNGLLISQDLNFIFTKWKIFNRFAIFDASEYDVRLYTYERDVLYGFSIPAFYGNGIRYYSTIEYKAHKNLTCWLRVARSKYYDKEEIGTGLEEIKGNTKTDWKIQVRYLF